MKDLTSGNIYKNFFLFALPIVFSGILSQMYSTINMIIAGRFIGEQALGAIGATTPLATFINSILWGFATGIGIYASSLFGAKKYYRLKSVVFNNFLCLAVAIVFLSVLLIIFKDYIYGFLKIDKSILKDADTYFVICTLGKVFILMPAAFVYIITGMGDSSFPFKMSILSSVLNIAGNVLSVTVFKIGVLGIALSSVLASLFVTLCYNHKLNKYFELLRVKKRTVRFSFKIIRETFQYSIPSMLQQSIMYFSSMILSPIVNGISASATASYTVVLKITDLNQNIYQNSARTIGSYTAQCYGAKKYGNLEKGFYVGIVQNILFVLPVLLVCIIFPNFVCGLFLDSEASATAVNYSVNFLKFCLPFIIFNVINNACHHFFRGIKRMTALLLATLCGSVARIVVSGILAPEYGIYGIYVGWVFSWFADAAFGLIYYYFGKWRKDLKV